jgi:molecular chaperone DnaK (HSP70)
MSQPLVVGIDLGTTHTVVAWSKQAAGAVPEAFPIPQLVSAGELESRFLLPSCLYARLDSEALPEPWIIGEYARRRGQEVPGRLIASPKSWLCHAGVDRTANILPWGAADDMSERMSPVEASARVLSHVKRAWNDAHPKNPLELQQVVLTVPASFDQVARTLTVRAAAEAGLAVRLLEEPQAAFYDALSHAGVERFRALVGPNGEPALVLVCDIGGGTTDLTLIRCELEGPTGVRLTRIAVGRHLLLGGDNMDLALAHLLESRLASSRLDARRFLQLCLACRAAKETLLGRGDVSSVPITLLGSGSALVGSTLRAELSRDDCETSVLDGFLPLVPRDAAPKRGRSGLVATGLPYEHDPAITRHLAAFVARHAAETPVAAVLLNGGVFRARRIAERVVEVVSSWSDRPVTRIEERDPDLAVARGAVHYGLGLAGHGTLIGGGAAHGYYVGVDGGRALCIVPRGSREGDRHLVQSKGLTLRVGKPVRFELYASDSGAVHAPGQLVSAETLGSFQRLPPVATTFVSDSNEAELEVGLEGELSPVGTLELACVAPPRRFALAFELRTSDPSPDSKAAPRSLRPSVRPQSSRFDEAKVALERVFGKASSDVREREVKDLMRELVRILGERETWSGELLRALFDALIVHDKARKRSLDHERVFWMLAGYCLRPGYGHPLDPGRMRLLVPLYEPGLTFRDEARGWQQFWIAWRRVSGGLSEGQSAHIRDRVDPFLDPNGKKPKGFKPQALDEMLELAASLERVPSERRATLGGWLLERTWTQQNPRLWGALGRIGSRAPAYASVHHVVKTRVAEEWLDHLLREKWAEVATAPRAGMQLARVTGDRARDVSEELRERTARALEAVRAEPEWIRAVRELVPIADRERAEFFGDEIPVGLFLVDDRGVPAKG